MSRLNFENPKIIDLKDLSPYVFVEGFNTHNNQKIPMGFYLAKYSLPERKDCIVALLNEGCHSVNEVKFFNNEWLLTPNSVGGTCRNHQIETIFVETKIESILLEEAILIASK